MSFTGVYIDDLEPEYGEFLNVSGENGVEFRLDIRPDEPGKLVKSIIDVAPDIVALDYRLDDNQKEFPDATYRAGGPAQMLREAMVERPTDDFPILLISTEENIQRLFGPDKTAHDLFDEWYFKKTLSDESNTPRLEKEIIALIRGYKSIGNLVSDPDKHLSLLGLTPDEWDQINPGSLKISLEESSVTHVIARVVLQHVIKRPGLLFRPIDVNARLSIAPENENLDGAFDYLCAQGLAYAGIFSDGWPRIWRHRFEQWTQDNIGGPLSSIPGNDRITNFNKIAGTEFAVAKSKWSNRDNELFAFACASCDAPTELRHSVAAHDPSVPKHGERKRICFDCVQTDAFARRLLRIDGDDEDVAERVRSGKFPKDQ